MHNLKETKNTIFQNDDTLTLQETKDGSISLKSHTFNESFHCLSGAHKESIDKFLRPSEIDCYRGIDKLNILDVCVGMGYNSGSLMESLINNSIYFHWWGLELDSRPLKIALGHTKFSSTWSSQVLENFKQIDENSHWVNKTGVGKMIWGDARQTIKRIHKNIFFDLILLDAFSPQQCPQLWSEEFLTALFSKLSTNGRLITYSRAASVRSSLRRQGLTIKSIIPTDSNSQAWSYGTIAFNGEVDADKQHMQKAWKDLSDMEEEHLCTIAAIPYRDPSGKSTALEINTRRKIEQKQSTLKSTSSWKKRWFNAKNT